MLEAVRRPPFQFSRNFQGLGCWPDECGNHPVRKLYIQISDNVLLLALSEKCIQISDKMSQRVNVRCVTPLGGRFDLVVLLKALKFVPKSHASTEQDRDHHKMHVVDEPGG
jgi:hypothetical protein